MSSPKYGYYSIQQSKNNQCAYVYLDSSGKEVYVTQIGDYYLEGDKLTKYFSDNKYVGEVTKYIKKVNVLNDSTTILKPIPNSMTSRMYEYYSNQQSKNNVVVSSMVNVEPDGKIKTSINCKVKP